MAETKATGEFKKHHTPIMPPYVVDDRISFVEEKTREKTVVKDENGADKTLDEKWEVVPYYQYDDGKVEAIHIEYHALPCYITTDLKGMFGPRRKIYAKVDRSRTSVCESILALGEVLKLKFVEAFLEQGFVKVFFGCKVNIVQGTQIREVLYGEYIAAHLAKTTSVGKFKVPIAAVRAAFEEKLLGIEASDGVDAVKGILRMDNFISIPTKPEMSPTKYIEITGFPTKAKSDSPQDKERYEIAKVQGSRILRIWCEDNLRGRLINDKLMPAIPEKPKGTTPEDLARYEKAVSASGWIISKKGTTYYTSDWHLMTYLAKGNTPWIGLCSTLSFRPSISKKTGDYSIVIDEEFTQGTLIDVRPSEFVAKSSASASAYNEEFADGGRTQAPTANASALARIASAGGVVEVDDEVNT